MISSEVQRTLVKSPPELWAELSDPAALARHLGELGEIRITRVEPEKLVEWEANGTKGTVAIKPSGWGTKVTLTVERELPVAEPPTDGSEATDEPALEEASDEAADPQDDLQAETSAPTSTDSTGVELDAWASQEADQPAITAAERFAHDDPAPLLGSRLVAEPPAEDEPEQHGNSTEPAPQTVRQEPLQDEPRRRLFARLFRRRRKQPKSGDPSASDTPGPTAETPTPEPGAQPLDAKPTSTAAQSYEPTALALAGTAAPLAPTPETPTEQPDGPSAAHAEPNVDPTELEMGPAYAEAAEEVASDRPFPDLAAELKQAEETAAEEVTAVLTGMLDRLGAAHHRPFSRS